MHGDTKNFRKWENLVFSLLMKLIPQFRKKPDFYELLSVGVYQLTYKELRSYTGAEAAGFYAFSTVLSKVGLAY
jgi:hypothetical protein